MKKKRKSRIVLKMFFVVTSFALLTWVRDVVQPLVLADATMLQLEDSDFSYMQFSGIERMFQYFWLLYILPLLVFVKDIKKLLS